MARDYHAPTVAVTAQHWLVPQDTFPDLPDPMRMIEAAVAKHGREHPGFMAAPGVPQIATSAQRLDSRGSCHPSARRRGKVDAPVKPGQAGA
jgi:hypothetical protein